MKKNTYPEPRSPEVEREKKNMMDERGGFPQQVPTCNKATKRYT